MSQPRGQIFKEWFRLARPFSLTASAVPVLFGTALALADGAFAWGPFLAMFLASLLIQAATNMFNEFYDERRGLDTATAVGIAGTIVRGRMHARAVLIGALFCYTVVLFRSEEHTSELQSRQYLVCRLLLEKKKIT